MGVRCPADELLSGCKQMRVALLGRAADPVAGVSLVRMLTEHVMVWLAQLLLHPNLFRPDLLPL